MKILLSSVFIFMLLLLSACSNTTNTIPLGNYETTIAEADIPTEFPAAYLWR